MLQSTVFQQLLSISILFHPILVFVFDDPPNIGIFCCHLPMPCRRIKNLQLMDTVCHVLPKVQILHNTIVRQELLHKRWWLTVKKVWDAVLEVDKCGKGGDAIVIRGRRIGNLDKVNAFAVAIVVNRLQAFENLVRLCWLWVVWREKRGESYLL